MNDDDDRRQGGKGNIDTRPVLIHKICLKSRCRYTMEGGVRRRTVVVFAALLCVTMRAPAIHNYVH